MTGNYRGVVAAEPLAVTNPKSGLGRQFEKMVASTTAPSDSSAREFLGEVVLDSESKCTDFLNGLVFAENSVNTTGDLGSTVLTALGTVFTPLTTVHALTAGATVVSGGKAIIDSDIYEKAAITNFQTALEKTYFSDMDSYAKGLAMKDHIVVSAEVAQIESIHVRCSLAGAEAWIAATLKAHAPESVAGTAGAPKP